jgi:DNA-directed RNA polymerase specialized sigma24 family protein
MERPISDLLAALAKGEKVETEIYNYYYRLAWEAAQKRIGGPIQSRVDPSEVANWALRDALSKTAKGKVRGSKHFQALLLTCVKDTEIDMARHATTKKGGVQREVADADRALLVPTKEPTPEEVVIAKEMKELVEKLLPDDDPLDSAIGYLYFMEDYSPKQIYEWLVEQSKKTGSKVIKTSAIRLRLNRIRDRLADSLKRKIQPP